ncbi:hypothetical protein GQ53DRAFT_417716 [Thozetella sp. PMI_491]|nr:hypothetical protein GQ53DRAFT_417716 [Thozetella sp. PMI_491]
MTWLLEGGEIARDRFRQRRIQECHLRGIKAAEGTFHDGFVALEEVARTSQALRNHLGTVDDKSSAAAGVVLDLCTRYMLVRVENGRLRAKQIHRLWKRMTESFGTHLTEQASGHTSHDAPSVGSTNEADGYANIELHLKVENSPSEVLRNTSTENWPRSMGVSGGEQLPVSLLALGAGNMREGNLVNEKSGTPHELRPVDQDGLQNKGERLKDAIDGSSEDLCVRNNDNLLDIPAAEHYSSNH